MKVINIVLSILIFLLSAVAATFSYFLFEKRSQFVTGWGKMAAAIHQSAQKLDAGSGTKVANELTVSALAHENYDKLDSLMGKLPAQAESIIAERNYLARALLNVNSQVGNSSNKVTIGALQGVDTYMRNANTVVNGVRTVISNRDRTFNGLMAMSRSRFGVTINRTQLINGDRKALEPLEKKLSAVETQRRAYDRFISVLCSSFRVSASRDANETMKKLDTAVKKHIRDYAMRGSEIRKYQNIKKSLEGRIQRNERTIAWQKKQITDRDVQITGFQRAFGLSEARPDTTPWAAGSVEARRAFTGKVISVNNKYGYFAIDAGKYSVVQQPIGNRILEVNPKIEPALNMLVVRRSGDKNEFIAKVQISQVGETSSIANIPPDAKAVKVGDIVTIDVDKAVTPAAKTPAKKTGKR